MYLVNHEQVRRRLGDRVHNEIDIYTHAVEAELRQYEFGARVTLVAEVRHAPTLPEYPKLFILLRWSAPVQGNRGLNVTYDVPVRELSAMVRKDIPSMNMALVDHVRRFAERLLTTLVLMRRPREMTGTGRIRSVRRSRTFPSPGGNRAGRSGAPEVQ